MGLARTLELIPTGTGYLEAGVGAGTKSGAEAWAELGYRPRHNVALFGMGRWSPAESYAGAGVRVTF